MKMPGHSRAIPRIPRAVRTLADLIAIVDRLRLYASELENMDRKEKQQLKELEDKKQKIREKTAKKRERYKTRIRALTPRAFTFAQEKKKELLNRRSKTVATLSTGNEMQWGTGLAIDLPENLDLFFNEMAELEKEDKYVRIKKEPNKIALRLSENAKEVETFQTVKRLEGSRISFKFPGVRRRVDAYIEGNNELKEVVVAELRE